MRELGSAAVIARVASSPSMPGHPDVHYGNVRVAAANELADDDACFLFENHAEALAQERLIVGQDDRDRVASFPAIVHGAPRSVIGIVAMTVHPPCCPGPTVAVPPQAAAPVVSNGDLKAVFSCASSDSWPSASQSWSGTPQVRSAPMSA
jgi:hypothetical protein